MTHQHSAMEENLSGNAWKRKYGRKSRKGTHLARSRSVRPAPQAPTPAAAVMAEPAPAAAE